MDFDRFRETLGRGTLLNMIKAVDPEDERRLEFRVFLDHVNELDAKTCELPDETIGSLIRQACPEDRYEQQVLLEAAAHECFFTTFGYTHLDEMAAYRAERGLITPAEFFRSVLPALFDVNDWEASALKKPASAKAYFRLLDLMTEGFPQVSPEESPEKRIQRDHIINVLMLYVKDADAVHALMTDYYAAGDLRSFLDLWFRTVIPEIVPEKAQPRDTPYVIREPELHYTFKKIQLVEILSLIDAADDDTGGDLKKLLGVDDLLRSNDLGIGYGITFRPDDARIPFALFHSVLEKAHPTYAQDIQQNRIPDVVWETVQKNYLRGKTEEADRAVGEAFLRYLQQSSSASMPFNIIRELMQRQEYKLALLLSHSYHENIENRDGFYEDLIERVDIIGAKLKKTDREYNRMYFDGYYEQIEMTLYKSIWDIICYRDRTFREPLFHDERDSHLNAETFERLTCVLAEYFSHPQIFWSREVFDIAYWLTDNLDKKMVSEDTGVYELIPEIVISLYWNMEVPGKVPSYDNIRQINGMGYSLALYRRPEYFSAGYRMLCTARQYYQMLPERMQRSLDGRQVKALVHSNMATYFVQASFFCDNRVSERRCLKLALLHDMRANTIRKTVPEGYENKEALSYTNYGTSLYYLGNYYREKEPETAKKYYLRSVRKNLRSVVLYSRLGDTSDQIVRAAIKVYGSALALRSCSPAFCTAEDLGYRNRKQELLDDFKTCLDCMEYDSDQVYVGSGTLEEAKSFYRKLPELLCEDE